MGSFLSCFAFIIFYTAPLQWQQTSFRPLYFTSEACEQGKAEDLENSTPGLGTKFFLLPKPLAFSSEGHGQIGTDEEHRSHGRCSMRRELVHILARPTLQRLPFPRRIRKRATRGRSGNSPRVPAKAQFLTYVNAP